MRMNRSWMLIALAIMLTFAATVAFAGGAQEEEMSEAEGPEVREITLWQHLDAPDEPYFYNLIDRFNEEHDDINVTFELIPWGGAFDQYTTAAVAGDAADVIFYATPVWGSSFWEMGVLEPLDSYVESWPEADRIVDSAWEGSRVSSDAPIFGVPLMSLPGILYYRADWFEELGLEPPTTREAFLEAAQAITEEIDGAYGFGMRGARGGTGMMLTFVLPAVDNQWFDSQGRSTFRQPEAIEAAQWYVDLFREHNVTPPSAPSDGFSEIMEGFRSGLTGMLIHHQMSAAGHVEELGEGAVSAVRVPEVNGTRWAEFGMHHYVVTTSSDYPDAAFEFASWMAEPEQAAYYGHYVGAVPVVEDVAEVDPYFEENEFAAISARSAANSYLPPYISTVGEFWEQVWPARFQQALLGDISVERMMEEFATLMEKGLAEKQAD